MDVLRGVAQLLIKHFIGGAESEALKAVNLAVCTNQTLKGYRKTSCQAEYLGVLREKLLLVFFCLAAEQTFARAADNACLMPSSS